MKHLFRFRQVMSGVDRSYNLVSHQLPTDAMFSSLHFNSCPSDDCFSYHVTYVPYIHFLSYSSSYTSTNFTQILKLSQLSHFFTSISSASIAIHRGVSFQQMIAQNKFRRWIPVLSARANQLANLHVALRKRFTVISIGTWDVLIGLELAR